MQVGWQIVDVEGQAFSIRAWLPRRSTLKILIPRRTFIEG